MLKYFNITTLVLFLTLAVSGQEDSLPAVSLEEVIVTGQYRPQSIKNSVYQVRTLSHERIMRQGATRLQDVLNSELNIRFSQDLATGGSNISLGGLSGQNVKILLDGIPVTGRQGTSNEININQIDINSIEKVEIVEGPMSVIYGADALAGVINIITKKSAKEKFSVNARLHEETAGNEYGIQQGTHNQYAGAGWHKNKWNLSGGFGRNYFGGWKGSAEGRDLEWHKKEQWNGNAVAGYQSAKWRIHYRLDALDETISNPGNFVGGEALDQQYITRRLMQQLQSSITLTDRLSFQGIAAWTDYSRRIYSTVAKPDGDVRRALGAGLQDITHFTGIVLRGTAVYKISSVISVQPGYDINLESGDGERIKTGRQNVNDYALFISSEFTPDSKISVRPGFRFVKNSVYDAPPIIPSLNAKLGILPTLDLRLAYARGFRAPSMRELYFYFFDASHQIEGNTDLKAETSNSFTGSLEWKPLKKEKTIFSSVLSGFYNRVNNMISIGQSASNANVFTYINISKYKTGGVQLNNQLRIQHTEFSLGMSYVARFNEFTENDPTLPSFKWSPELNGSFSHSFVKAKLSVSLFYKYTGQMPSYQLTSVNNQQVIQEAKTEGYHWADLSLNKKIFGALTINAGIRNLFDIKRINSTLVNGSAHSESGPRPIAYGRSFFTGLIFNWQKK